MEIDLWLIYSVVAITNIISPGPAIILAINNSLSYGIKSVFISSLGNLSGLLILSSVAMLGLGAILQTSGLLFNILKFVGACYLIYLGIKKLKSNNILTDNIVGVVATPKSKRQLYKEGFLIAATNPKAILFFTALFPMFINSKTSIGPQFFILTSTFMLYSFISLLSYGVLSKSIKYWLYSGNRMVWFHKITGGIFISMGLGLLSIKNANAS
jgi:homoserine/homoserine lactone efflux protein